MQEAKVEAPKAKDSTAGNRAKVGELERLFYAMGTTPEKYALSKALPLVAAGLFVALLLPVVLVPLAGDLVGTYAPWAVGALLAALAGLIPFLVRDAKRQAVDQQMHVFITHLGVLSTTPMSRVDLFRVISEKQGYGPLADECAKIAGLVKHWRMSLPEACRFTSARTPSPLLSDFLDRFAHALEAGDKLEDYLVSEQTVVMHQYSSKYERRLKDIEGFRELFSSLMMSAVFLAVFAMLMPVLTNIDSSTMVPLVLLATAGLQGMLLALARSKSPRDPLWHALDERGETEQRLRVLLPAAAAVGLALVVAGFLLGLTPGIILALGSSPPALAALLLMREEDQVRRRDDNYPAFIRSLGAGTAARAGTPTEAVEQLAQHDFGPLTPPLARLHRRLALRLHNPLAWRKFGAETGSNIIHTFTAMFLEAAREGGSAMKTGAIISQNATVILALRKQRAQVAAQLRGTLMGMAGALSFTLYLNVGILGLLGGLFQDVDVAEGLLPGVGASGLDLPGMTTFVTVLSVSYAIAASLSIRLIAGGRLRGAFGDAALMLWISGLTGLAVDAIGGALIGG